MGTGAGCLDFGGRESRRVPNMDLAEVKRLEHRDVHKTRLLTSIAAAFFVPCFLGLPIAVCFYRAAKKRGLSLEESMERLYEEFRPQSGHHGLREAGRQHATKVLEANPEISSEDLLLATFRHWEGEGQTLTARSDLLLTASQEQEKPRPRSLGQCSAGAAGGPMSVVCAGLTRPENSAIVLPAPAQAFFAEKMQTSLTAPIVGYLSKISGCAYTADLLHTALYVDQDRDLVQLRSVQEVHPSRGFTELSAEPLRVTSTMELPLSLIEQGALDTTEKYKNYPVTTQFQVFSWNGWSGVQNPLFNTQLEDAA